MLSKLDPEILKERVTFLQDSDHQDMLPED